MFVHWRECEHEEVDWEVFDDHNDNKVLRECGMYNFF
jgi:hypothetical protein